MMQPLLRGIPGPSQVGPRTHQVTATYAELAREVDAYIFGERTERFANWFHFATWGTWTVGQVIRSAPDTELGRALAQAEERIFEDVTGVARRFLEGWPMPDDPVGHGFNLYRMARSYPEMADNAMFLGTTSIVTHEQTLIDDDLAAAFAAVPWISAGVLTSLLSVKFPTETLLLAEDVPGHPGTAAQDWRNLEQRLVWATAACDARQGDPSLFASPYEGEDAPWLTSSAS